MLLAIFVGAPQTERFQLYFFTANWCGPCRAVYPVLDKYKNKEKNCVSVTVVDFDAARNVASQFNVETVPVVIEVETNGRPVFRIDGAGREELKSLDAALAETVRRCRARK